MAEEKIPYAKMAIAVAVGIMVGALIASGDSDEVRKLNRRIAALEEGASEQVTALAERVNELGSVESAVAAAQSAVDELGARVGELAEMPTMPEPDPEAEAQAEAAMAALNDRVAVLADQMGRLATSMLSGTMPSMAPEAEEAPAEEAEAAADAAPAEDAAPADEAAAPAEEATEAEAEAADEAAEETPVAEAAPTEAEGGEVGLLLAVGDTGMVGDTRLFVSRIDTEREAVRLMVVGEGPRMLGTGYGPLDLGNGCTVTLKGIVDRMALVVGSCGG